ncbi:hypothetical protein DFH06DRAFT_1341176 [Mycena polygramma]|nr:hypothetical protein DFH06DRAFT_1341176 [Mycena polygramma]
MHSPLDSLLPSSPSSTRAKFLDSRLKRSSIAHSLLPSCSPSAKLPRRLVTASAHRPESAARSLAVYEMVSPLTIPLSHRVNLLIPPSLPPSLPSFLHPLPSRRSHPSRRSLLAIVAALAAVLALVVVAGHRRRTLLKMWLTSRRLETHRYPQDLKAPQSIKPFTLVPLFTHPVHRPFFPPSPSPSSPLLFVLLVVTAHCPHRSRRPRRHPHPPHSSPSSPSLLAAAVTVVDFKTSVGNCSGHFSSSPCTNCLVDSSLSFPIVSATPPHPHLHPRRFHPSPLTIVLLAVLLAVATLLAAPPPPPSLAVAGRRRRILLKILKTSRLLNASSPSVTRPSLNPHYPPPILLAPSSPCSPSCSPLPSFIAIRARRHSRRPRRPSRRRPRYSGSSSSSALAFKTSVGNHSQRAKSSRPFKVKSLKSLKSFNSPWDVYSPFSFHSTLSPIPALCPASSLPIVLAVLLDVLAALLTALVALLAALCRTRRSHRTVSSLVLTLLVAVIEFQDLNLKTPRIKTTGLWGVCKTSVGHCQVLKMPQALKTLQDLKP